MKSYPWEVVLLSVVFLANRLIARASWGKASVFWTIQSINLGAAFYIAYYGISGLEAFGPVNYMVSALLIFHIVQNFGIHQRVRQASLSEEQFRKEAQKARSIAQGRTEE